MLRISFRRPSLALAGILIAIGGCAESPSTPAAREFVQRTADVRYNVSGAGSTSAVINPSGGVLQTAAGDRIVFPAGAVAQPTRITITSDPRYAGVELEPHGLQFPAGHEPVLQINMQGSNAGAYRSLSVVYVNESGAVAEVLPTSTGASRATANLAHFSGYLVAGG
ncbi:MAG TPA: hypothetical protein VFS20_18925 [Longimicrobium sp.]|nr:hypothetical protein [Longimicrobium sp.]